MVKQLRGSYPAIILSSGRERALLHGHPWVFSGAIAEVRGDPRPGETVHILSSKGEYLATGFYNPRCDIALRIVSLKPNEKIDGSFWRGRIRSALQLRRRLVSRDTTAFRIVNAEGDGIPGFIADKYGEFVVVSFETAGVELVREEIVSVLMEELAPRGIYERSTGQARIREGLSARCGTVWGQEPPEQVEILEYGNRFLVDVKGGQKTGFFLDQRENRKYLEQFCAQARVLNCFSYTGGFTLYALRGGAKEVVSVDVSESAVYMINHHLELNRFDTLNHRPVCADVFQYLRSDDERYDIICLDPPPFARSRRDVKRAFKGYKDINRLALKKLNDGGLLMTFSCSGAVDEETFYQAISQASQEAGCTVKLLARLGASPDHPTLVAHPEGRYLKGFMISVLERYERV